MTDYTISVLSALLVSLPLGTNLALLHFMWMLVSGALLPPRGAIFPALKSTGLSDAATRRAWGALRKGVWQIALRLTELCTQMQAAADQKDWPDVLRLAEQILALQPRDANATQWVVRARTDAPRRCASAAGHHAVARYYATGAG